VRVFLYVPYSFKEVIKFIFNNKTFAGFLSMLFYKIWSLIHLEKYFICNRKNEKSFFFIIEVLLFYLKNLWNVIKLNLFWL